MKSLETEGTCLGIAGPPCPPVKTPRQVTCGLPTAKKKGPHALRRARLPHSLGDVWRRKGTQTFPFGILICKLVIKKQDSETLISLLSCLRDTESKTYSQKAVLGHVPEQLYLN